jgi:large subunit ribosomal protein L7/L12
LKEREELQALMKDPAFIEKLNFASSAPTNTAPQGEAKPVEAVKEEPKVEKTQFDVYLKGFDAKIKLNLIKEIRGILNLGLKEVT